MDRRRCEARFWLDKGSLVDPGLGSDLSLIDQWYTQKYTEGDIQGKLPHPGRLRVPLVYTYSGLLHVLLYPPESLAR
jgi:hypothetical protein